MLDFDWDDANLTHIAGHGVSQEEAEDVIRNQPLELAYEVRGDEERITELGRTRAGRILAVVSTWRVDKIRVITAYDATRRMQQRYMTEVGESDAPIPESSRVRKRSR